MFSDYHTHTIYSNHGKGHPREMAAIAVERGMPALGFSEHFPLPEGFTEPSGTANMRWEQIEQYIREVREAQEEFGSRLKILLGYEVDYLPTADEVMRANLAKYSPDYKVGSIHIVDRFRSDHENWLIDYSPGIFEEGLEENGGPEAVYRRYYELVRDYARAHDHAIVGHLDLIKKYNAGGRYFDLNGNDYLSQVEATLDVLKAAGKIVEINTAGLFKEIGELYPSDRVLQMMLERRLPICLSSDAHQPGHVAREFSSTWDKLIKMGFEQLTGL
ncbi:MAG TPA: histidinol-phosphatase HisJ [Chloroflexia bacterium]|nr:histidinol-phosphatase HisJ [Chloroflexia bacterium]